MDKASTMAQETDLSAISFHALFISGVQVRFWDENEGYDTHVSSYN